MTIWKLVGFAVTSQLRAARNSCCVFWHPHSAFVDLASTAHIKIVAISGSLRTGSSNTAARRAAERLAPAGVQIELFEGIGELPFFNPDIDGDSTSSQRGGASRTGRQPEFPNKPVALINTSSRATHALDALSLRLETMSARLVQDAWVTLPFLATTHDEQGIVADEAPAGRLGDAIARFAAAIRSF